MKKSKCEQRYEFKIGKHERIRLVAWERKRTPKYYNNSLPAIARTRPARRRLLASAAATAAISTAAAIPRSAAAAAAAATAATIRARVATAAAASAHAHVAIQAIAAAASPRGRVTCFQKRHAHELLMLYPLIEHRMHGEKIYTACHTKTKCSQRKGTHRVGARAIASIGADCQTTTTTTTMMTTAPHVGSDRSPMNRRRAVAVVVAAAAVVGVATDRRCEP